VAKLSISAIKPFLHKINVHRYQSIQSLFRMSVIAENKLYINVSLIEHG